MAYFQKVYKTGKVIEIEKSYSARLGIKGTTHKDKTEITPEQMEKVNEEHRIRKLRRKLQANFEFGDLHITLTYAKDRRLNPKEAKKNLSRLIAFLRREYKKLGKELKYVLVTEYQHTAIHHHLVINNVDNTMQLIRKKWTRGKAYTTMLDDTGLYGDLAAYLIKETKDSHKDKDNPNKLSYTCSRNLIDPEPDIKILNRDNWLEIPKAKKGYWIPKDSLVNSINPRTGTKVQRYILAPYSVYMDEFKDKYIQPRAENKEDRRKGK